MHEVSLCENIIRQLQDSAEQENFNRVKTIWLEIGKLSHVTAEAMLFAFEMVAKNSLAEGARLEIVNVPARGCCNECGGITAMEQRFDACKACGHYPLSIEAGEEMRIKNIEVL